MFPDLHSWSCQPLKPWLVEYFCAGGCAVLFLETITTYIRGRIRASHSRFSLIHPTLSTIAMFDDFEILRRFCHDLSYPLVMTNIAIENGHRNSEFSHEKWWFSIAFCMFTRGYLPWFLPSFRDHREYHHPFRRSVRPQASVSASWKGPGFALMMAWRSWIINISKSNQKCQNLVSSLDWFKGKSTGNHGFYHQI